MFVNSVLQNPILTMCVVYKTEVFFLQNVCNLRIIVQEGILQDDSHYPIQSSA